ncbi:MAG: CvpA family protein [Elusimicrobiota bacterium]
MTLDLCSLALIGIFALGGYFSGAVRQISHWIGLAAAYLFVRPAAAILEPVATACLGWSAAQNTIIGLNVVLMPVILIVASWAARLILNTLEPGDERGPLDRGIGVLVGAAKGGAVVFVLLCLAVSLEKPLSKIHFDLEAKTRGSSSMAFVREHNLFADERLPALNALKKPTTP